MLHGVKGRKDAIGALIPDALYDESMEGRNLFFLYMEFPWIAKRLKWRNLELLEDLEWVHNFEQVTRWRKCLKRVAKKHGLKFRTGAV